LLSFAGNNDFRATILGKRFLLWMRFLIGFRICAEKALILHIETPVSLTEIPFRFSVRLKIRCRNFDGIMVVSTRKRKMQGMRINQQT
jgi:hypothetical protein